MKASQFKKLIKEAVKEAVEEALIERQVSLFQETPQEPKPLPEQRQPIKGDPVSRMIEETRQQMTSEDFKNVINADSSMAPNFQSMMSNPEPASSTVQSGPTPGIDISNLDFVKKASAVHKAAEEKDKLRHGI